MLGLSDARPGFAFATPGRTLGGEGREPVNRLASTRVGSFLLELGLNAKPLRRVDSKSRIRGAPPIAARSRSQVSALNYAIELGRLGSSRKARRLSIRRHSLVNSFSEPSPAEGPTHFTQVDDAEAPSCVFVGPIEREKKERLECLYSQARDAYYSGSPIIHDEMYDQIEKRLRFFGSDLVLKYPRCSLKKFSVYADAVFDQSQITALAGVWTFIFCSGIFLISSPAFFLIQKISQDFQLSYKESQEFSAYFPHGAVLEWVSLYGAISALSIVLGSAVSIAAAKSLREMSKGTLLALKGSCPQCGEEVYAFVRTDETVRPRHKCECHVCQHPLVFHANIEATPSQSKWAYGRIYSVARTVDLGH